MLHMAASYRTANIRPASLLLLLLFVTCVPRGACSNNPCARSPGFPFRLVPVPEPAQCRHYALCFRGIALASDLPCPAGTAFDPETKVCTSRLHEPCLVQENRSKVQTQLKCPDQKAVTFFPDYSQACPSNHYFRCQRGVISGQVCAKGLVFDEGTDTCVTMTSYMTSSSTVWEECGRRGGGGAVCSLTSQAWAAYANYTFGCPALKFSLCLGKGASLVVTCPEGLFYNGAIKNCDYPQNVVCGKNVPVHSRLEPEAE